MNFLNFFSVKLCRLKILQFFVKSKWQNISITYSLFVKAAMKTVISTMGDLNVRFVLHMNYVPIARKKVFTTITNWSKMFRGMFVYFLLFVYNFFFLIFKIFFRQIAGMVVQIWQNLEHFVMKKWNGYILHTFFAVCLHFLEKIL